MGRIEPKPLTDTPLEEQLAQDITALAGRVPNFYRTVAHSPAALRWLLPLVSTLHRGGTGTALEMRIKNLIVLKTSIINGCKYCTGHNQAMARSLGVNEERLALLEGDDWKTDPSIQPEERAALWWAELVTTNVARYDEQHYEELTRHFSEQEVVEITLLCGLFNMINRFNDSLRVDLEDHDEQHKIGRSAQLGQDQIVEYARRRVAEHEQHGLP